MEALSREELARFLDRVSHLYPHGIPRETVVAPAPRTHRFAVGFVVPAPDPLPESLRLLLEGITIKGLSLDPARTTTKLCSVADANALSAAVDELVNMEDANVVVVLGAIAEAPGTWREVSGRPVLHTRSLGEIESDKGIKREFWGHLQGVIAKMANP